MAKGANRSEEFRLAEEDFRNGGKRGWNDVWDWNCDRCGGGGLHQNRPCGTCGGRGYVVKTEKPAIEIAIPKGCRPGQKLRVRGYGHHGSPNTAENRGDLIITLRPFGDGEMRDELAAAPTQVLPIARARALPR